MIKSMTGYGVATAENEKYIVRAEVRSLNGKFLELNVRMPRFLQDREFAIRNTYNKLIERGSATVLIICQAKPGTGNQHTINVPLAELYHNQVKQLGEKLNLRTEDMINTLVTLPDVVVSNDEELTEEDWEFISRVIREAYEQYDLFRETEGKSITEVLNSYVDAIEKAVELVETLEPERTAAIRTRLETGLSRLTDQEGLDRNRLEQEILYYIEKLDISEEKTRLKQHCRFFRDTLGNASNGKKLGFISQEMGREINTMGAKANHFGIQQAVVKMKEELEKIKEQVNNVL